jgi:pimeloyl-ACP methyl ester carboxylesterase
MARPGLILAILASAILAAPGLAQAAPADASSGCRQGTQPSGALWLACIPPGDQWNGGLVVVAHGYVPVTQPLGFANLTLPDGTSLPDLVEGEGYAFATTSYRENGLAILDGAQDVLQLVATFRTVCRCAPAHVYLVGVSEGGLVATLLIERSPRDFSGALAACAPIGDFAAQIDYLGDFRVLFDALFPGVLPGSAIHVPDQAIARWTDTYAPAAADALLADPFAGLRLLAIAHVAADPSDFFGVFRATEELLGYSAYATDDAAAKLGGNPYDNHARRYAGSADDALLNQTVARYRAAPAARARLADYATSGRPLRPLVTLHTTGDELVPSWHESLYRQKARARGSLGRLTQISVDRYGHCNFTADEVTGAFDTLVRQVNER